MKTITGLPAAKGGGLSIGTVLQHVGSASTVRHLFLIVGICHKEIALVRLFDNDSVEQILGINSYRLQYKVKWDALATKIGEQLIADLSRFIIKDMSQLMAALSKNDNLVVGNIHRRDLTRMLLLLRLIHTISLDLKNRFL